jgi:hypothetical protein
VLAQRRRHRLRSVGFQPGARLAPERFEISHTPLSNAIGAAVKKCGDNGRSTRLCIERPLSPHFAKLGRLAICDWRDNAIGSRASERGKIRVAEYADGGLAVRTDRRVVRASKG